MAVGEILLSAFFQMLFDRLASRELLNFVRQFQGGLDSELKKWESTLTMIQAVLSNAEEKQLTDRAVKFWLDDLRDLAYDAEDILDEFATEASKRKSIAEELDDQLSTSKSQNFFPGFFSCLNLSTVKFNTSMESKIKSITNRFKELGEKRTVLGLQGTSGGTSTAAEKYRPPSSSVSTERAVYGRDEDKAKVLEMVLSEELSDHVNIRVIPIVGMAGVGKTTLAREVYNDKAVEAFKFDIKAWVCVSDVFDALSISKTLLRKITSRPCDEKDFDEVQVELQKAVEGKKFLLVLDDVWNENDSLWETLTAPFMAGAPSSKIIVTTRHSDVASTMGAIEQYNIKCLADEDCWSVIMMHAFQGRDINNAHQISEIFREKLVKKCGGLPLAAKSLGGLLRTKKADAWVDILNNNIWDLPKQSGILPALRLSYHYLPSHLKICFVYCAIFPKDFEFEKKELVHLWIAEGIIQHPRNDKQLEDWGSQCFDDLVSRSIFQQSSSDSSKFIMHHLVHDLALLASGETIFRLEEANKLLSRRFERVRHASYSHGKFDGKRKFDLFYKLEQLRTFLPVSVRGGTTSYITNMVLSDVLPKLKKLRVLSLAGYYITHLPNLVKDLRLLRYLNLSGTMIKSLPESTSSLLNLQFLILRNCSRLIELPPKLRNLINLYYLDIKGADLLKEMPLGMKELRDLHMLSNFIVGKGTGSSLKDLKHLKFLRGELCISGLENVNHQRDANEATLCEKLNLEALELEWRSSLLSNSRDEAVEGDVLDVLRPHKNIKRLTIRNYGGARFPSWIGDPSFSKMEVLELEHSENCMSLPSLGLLGSLKQLTIKGMKGLKSIGSEIYGEGSLKPFQSLEILLLENLPEWENWDANIRENEYVEIFPHLRELSIVECPKFSGNFFENLPLLETLVISKCAELVVSFSSFPKLSRLQVDECKGLVCSTPVDCNLTRFMTISNSSLDIYGCKGMLYNSPTDLLKSVTISNFLEFGKFLKQGFQMVETLAIGNSEEVKSWRQYGVFEFEKPVQGLQILMGHDEVPIEANNISLLSFPEINLVTNNLRFLKIENIRALVSLPEEMMGNNARLERLYISDCDSLTFIGRRKLPSSLKSLEILFCQNLEHLVIESEDGSSSSSSSSSATLKYLTILGCHKLTTLSSGIQILEALEYLLISDCPRLESIPDGLHNLNCLQRICIDYCPSLVYFPVRGLPNGISSVSIARCEKLQALPEDLHKLSSLQYLEIKQCPSIVSSPGEGFPTNLTSLEIGDVKIYKALIKWGLHRLTSIRRLWIHECHNAKSFPDEEMGMMLPPSLIELIIWRFPKLKYLSSFQSLTSLEHLWIYNCPMLKSFPEVRLPSSLLELRIEDCPLLKEQFKRNKGKEWSKIAHIPCVMIDDRFIYDPEEEE